VSAELDQMRARPTPTPWIANGYDIRQDARPHGGRMIAYFGPHHTAAHEYPAQCRREDEANAAHAVMCVNEHAATKARAEVYESLIAAALGALPVGNIRTHTPGSIPDRITDLAKALAEATMEAEAAEALCAELRDAAEEAYNGSVDAAGYPDGPCLDRETRQKLNAALAKTPADMGAELVRLRAQVALDERTKAAMLRGGLQERDALRARVAEQEEKAERYRLDALKFEARNTRLVAAGNALRDYAKEGCPFTSAEAVASWDAALADQFRDATKMVAAHPDTERLDWLDAECEVMVLTACFGTPIVQHNAFLNREHAGKLRAAIDAAMRTAKEVQL
jgi:hypothetical protein